MAPYLGHTAFLGLEAVPNKLQELAPVPELLLARAAILFSPFVPGRLVPHGSQWQLGALIDVAIILLTQRGTGARDDGIIDLLIAMRQDDQDWWCPRFLCHLVFGAPGWIAGGGRGDIELDITFGRCSIGAVSRVEIGNPTLNELE